MICTAVVTLRRAKALDSTRRLLPILINRTDMLNKKMITGAMLLIACAASAHADNREEMGKDSQGNAVYLETDNMTRKGYMVHAWQQVNRVQPDDKGAMHVRSQLEFDCKYKKSRTMWVTLQTEPDGKGSTISSAANSDPEWLPAEDGTLLGKMLEFSCLHVFRTKATLM